MGSSPTEATTTKYRANHARPIKQSTNAQPNTVEIYAQSMGFYRDEQAVPRGIWRRVPPSERPVNDRTRQREAAAADCGQKGDPVHLPHGQSMSAKGGIKLDMKRGDMTQETVATMSTAYQAEEEGVQAQSSQHPHCSLTSGHGAHPPLRGVWTGIQESRGLLSCLTIRHTHRSRQTGLLPRRAHDRWSAGRPTHHANEQSSRRSITDQSHMGHRSLG
ncbi:hypothetical protein IWX49DRAFT_556141 [Phyllosticta citricarpa]|uniref:Uncharacterized protein n=2 Tax=Phyllosticta TaxID=121621 RepID=A0ABR1MGW4_9PEZI